MIGWFVVCFGLLVGAQSQRLAHKPSKQPSSHQADWLERVDDWLVEKDRWLAVWLVS